MLKSRVCKLQDEVIAVIALVSFTGGMVFFALSYNVPMIFLSSCLGFGARMGDSLLRSLVSQVGLAPSQDFFEEKLIIKLVAESV